MLDTLARPAAPLAPSARPAGAALVLGSYGRVALEARVASASPHQLVVILYRRLAQLMREAEGAAEAGDTGRRLRATEKAIAIVEGLDSTLDHARGGSVAESLAQVYALVRQRLLDGGPQALAEARDSVEAIGAAWEAIAAAGR